LREGEEIKCRLVLNPGLRLEIQYQVHHGDTQYYAEPYNAFSQADTC
jgi:hypothetical protein